VPTWVHRSQGGFDRRRYEVVELAEAPAREYILIWDNHKARRNRRRLEVGRETAFAIQEWLAIRRTLKVPARSRTFLFPTARHGYDACIDADTVAKMLRRWVDGLPELVTDTAGRPGRRASQSSPDDPCREPHRRGGLSLPFWVAGVGLGVGSGCQTDVPLDPVRPRNPRCRA
jgi:hypothetical protein